MFYSIFSNNCQHFILDLCEYIELQPNSISNPVDSGTNNELDTEFERDLGPKEGETQGSNIQNLWIKSRLIFLLGSGLHFLFSFILPFITIKVSRWGEAHGNKSTLLIFLVLPFYGFSAWLSFSGIIIGHEKLPLTMDGHPYLHSTCHTGPFMRRLILTPANRYYCALVRFLLRMEKLPHSLFLLFGYIFAAPFALAQIDVPSLYLDTRWSRFNRQQWATIQVGFLLIFISGHSYDIVLQSRKLRQQLQRYKKTEEEEEALLEQQNNQTVQQYAGTEEQDQRIEERGESSRSQLG